PAAGFFGADSFSFQVSDGVATSKADVTITVGRLMRYSTDITVDLGTLTAGGSQVVQEDTATGVLSVVLTLPAHVDGYQLRDDGMHLLSFETTTTLGGLTVGPADVVAWNGTTASLVFDAAAHGIPNGANVSAIAMFGTSLLLACDTTV